MSKQTPHSLGCIIKGMTGTSYHKPHCLQPRDGFSYNSQSPKSRVRVWAGPWAPPSGGSRKGSLPPPPGLTAASLHAISSGRLCVSSLVRSLDLGCPIRGELGRWLSEKLLGVCELGEQGPWKACLAVRMGLQWSLSA